MQPGGATPSRPTSPFFDEEAGSHSGEVRGLRLSDGAPRPATIG